MILRFLGLLLAATVLLPACSNANGRQPAAQSGGNGRPPVAVSVETAATSEFTEAVDVIGSLSPKFAADVKSEVSGTVTAVYVTQWVPVKRGAKLAKLDTSEAEAGIEALKALEAQARVAESRARREQARAVQLKEFGLITQQAFDEATSALEAAEAATRAAAAQVRTGEARLAKSSIQSPMDGVIAERNVSIGDRVENMGGNAPMFRIVDNRLLDLTVTVPAKDLAGVRIGQKLEFTTDGVPGRTFTGTVMFINPALDEANRSVKVVAEVPNRDGTLRGGLFVKGRIIVATRPAVLHVPNPALLNWDVSQHAADVFVVLNDKASKRRVRTGAVSGDEVEILEGLTAGERVVVRGGFALRDGDRVAAPAPGK